MYVTRETLGQEPTPLEESLRELANAGWYIQASLQHYLFSPHDSNRRRLDDALDTYERATDKVKHAGGARQAVDRGLPRIAQAVKEARKGEGTP